MSKLTEAASALRTEEVSELWLELLEKDPPYEEMREALDLLIQGGEGETARDLLEMTIDEKELEGGEGFQDLLKFSAPKIHSSEPLRKALLEMLRDEHLMFQPLERFLKLSGLKKEGADVSEAWSEFNGLMLYRDGGFLYHSTFGTGCITRVSRTHVTADFRTISNHDIELDVALETSLPLPEDSLAVLSYRDRDALFEMLRESPGEFLNRLLEEPFVRDGVISIDVLAPLAGNVDNDVDELWKLLKAAASSADGFADLGSRIVKLDENVRLVEQLREILWRRKVSVSKKVEQVASLIKSFSGSRPDSLDELLGDIDRINSPETGSLFELCWVLDGPAASGGFQRAKSGYIEGTAARAERALAEIHSQSCRKEYVSSFFLSDAAPDEKVALLTSLRRSLWEHAVACLETGDPDLLSQCISLYLSDPSRTDLFLWSLAYLASSGRSPEEGTGSGGVELFLDNLIFASADTQKKVIGILMGPLREDLGEFLSSIDTRRLNRYLETFDTSATAHNEGLYLTIGRELSRRRSSGMKRSQGKHFWETEVIYSSREAIRRRQEEILHLKQVEIPAAAEAIGEAASHGDLSENAEYTAAIEKRDLLLDRLKRWSEELQHFSPYPPGEISTEVVSPGVRVMLQDTGESETVQILEVVGPLDADPESGRINYMAPLGRVLLGSSQGDEVVLPGSDENEWRVVSIQVLDMVSDH